MGGGGEKRKWGGGGGGRKRLDAEPQKKKGEPKVLRPRANKAVRDYPQGSQHKVSEVK